jgi:hypothetical protein
VGGWHPKEMSGEIQRHFVAYFGDMLASEWQTWTENSGASLKMVNAI